MNSNDLQIQLETLTKQFKKGLITWNEWIEKRQQLIIKYFKS